jgi:hypothetical protein
MKKHLALALLVLGLAMSANAQVQSTAETMGKGKFAAFVSANAIVVKDFTTMSFSSAQLWYGLTNRADVFAGTSETTLLGQEQTAVMVGGNINLLKSKVLSLSAFNTLSAPLNRRRDACGATWFTALVVSKDFKKLTPYGGYAVTLPLGHVEGKLFTPAEPMHNIPVGFAKPIGKHIFVFAEYNFGRKQQVAGLALAYTF